MGMFDSIYLEMECPYCKKISEMEAQTKQLECELNIYRKGDSLKDCKLDMLFCYADCKSDECMDHELRDMGYRSGFGRAFDVTVFIDNGVVNGNYEINTAWFFNRVKGVYEGEIIEYSLEYSFDFDDV
jgi:hypothetical protein